MKKYIFILSVILCLTACLLLCGTAVAASGTEKVTAECSQLEQELRGAWFYVPSTLPEGVNGAMYQTAVYITPIGKYNTVAPTVYSAEMISGDKGMRNLIQFNKSAGSVWMSIDLTKVEEPGEATYRISLGDGKLHYEGEFTIRVLSWKDEPLFDIIGDGDTAIVQISNGQNNTYYYETIAAMFLKDHYMEIVRNHPELSSKGRAPQIYINLPGGYAQDELREGWNCYQFLSPCSYNFNLQYDFGAIHYNRSITLTAPAYSISGSKTVSPGAVKHYTVIDTEPASGRTFTLTAEGEGVTFDAETGTLTVAEDTSEGTAFTITATPSDGGTDAILNGKVYNGALPDEPFVTNSSGGFLAPIIMSGGMDLGYYGGKMINYLEDPAYSLFLSYATYWLDEFAEDTDKAEAFYDKVAADLEPAGIQILERKDVMIGGHPVLLIIGGEEDDPAGLVVYARDKGMLWGELSVSPQNGADAGDIPQVTMRDLERIAENIGYNPAEAPITLADGKVTLTAKDGVSALTAGKRLQLTANFANPEKVNKKAKNDDVSWSVSDENGGAPEGIKIDKKGVLTADKKVKDVKKVTVTGTATYFGTTGTFDVTVIPAADAITTEPEELFFYIGEDKTETVKTKISPDTVPLIGITWKVNKEGIVEIIPNEEDGTAQIRAINAGKADVTVTEPGGKKAKLKITVADPVTAVELSAKGKTAPGGTVTVTAKLTPKKPGNAALEWSLDTTEDIATINAKGQVKIAKTASAGTVITVTCKALGAPEPVEAKIQIEVTEK